MRPAVRTSLVATAALVATLAIAIVPHLSFAYRNAALNSSIETAEVLVGSLVATLVLTRFRVTRRAGDLLLAAALLVLTLGNLVFAAVPHIVSNGRGTATQATSGAAITARAIGAVLLLSAAFAPWRRMRRVPSPWAIGAAAVGFLVFVGACAAAVPARLTRDPHVVVAAPTFRESRPAVAFLFLVVALLFCAASARFTFNATRLSDRLSAWLGVGCALHAVGWFNYTLYPSLHTEWFFSGDVFRLLGYLAWLVGALAEVAAYIERQPVLAAADERRRVARDLHDGLAHELAFIVTRMRQLARDVPAAQRRAVTDLQSASERALDESRRAISALSTSDPGPFLETLTQVVEDLSARHGVTGSVVSAADVDIPGRTQEDVLRIVREAFTNAARHGRASHIRVELLGDPSRLRVIDDGAGFAVDRVGTDPPDGFGLVSMRERAATAQATFTVNSTIGKGTTVELTWL